MRLIHAFEGRDLLLRLGYICQFHDAARRKPIPDQLRATYKVAPIPCNMDPRLHQGRKEARVEALERTYAHKNTTYYVDAANYDHANNKAATPLTASASDLPVAMASLHVDVSWCTKDTKDTNRFLLVGTDIRLFQVSDTSSKETNRDVLPGAEPLAIQSDLEYFRCYSCYMNPRSDVLLAVGQDTGKVNLVSFGRTFHDQEWASKEFVPKQPRRCNMVAWNPVNYSLCADIVSLTCLLVAVHQGPKILVAKNYVVFQGFRV
ncbi:hypothetical protein MRX96_039633 [Rhipicephalus microplus]